MPATSTGALEQFFKWLSAEQNLTDPMAGLHPPKVAGKLVPVFTAAELERPEHGRAGRGFAQRRDAAIIAVLGASGIRLAELVAIRYDPSDVKISYDVARVVDRYLRARARHSQA